MLLEAMNKPLKYRLKTGEEVTLRPGIPMDLPDQAATQLLKKAPDMVKRVDRVSTIGPGSAISWQGADLTLRKGIVEFLHTDTAGQLWAFVTLPNVGWAAVNLKYAS
jgi:hypothetical protein